MKVLLTYSKFVHIALAVLFLAASAGFTGTLHSCAMKDRACCESMVSGGTMHGGALPLPGERAVSGKPVPCCLTSIAGGLNANPIILEKQGVPAQKLACGVTVPVDDFCCLQPASFLKSHSSSSEEASPPAVGKYLLFASLLI